MIVLYSILGTLAALLVAYGIRVGIFYLDTTICMSGNSTDPCRVKLDYETFRSLYCLAKDCYKLFRYDGCGPCVKYYSPDSSNGHTLIYFKSFLDWLKVKRMFKTKDKQDIADGEIKALKNFLKDAQNDLDRFKKDEKIRGRRMSNAESMATMLGNIPFVNSDVFAEITSHITKE